MSTLHLLANHFLSVLGTPCGPNNPSPCDIPKIDAHTKDSIRQVVENLQLFIGPIFLAIVGFFSITFLMKKKMKDFIAFLALAIIIAVVFYTPGIIENLAKMVAGLFGTVPTS
jgi:hypothetical protein